MAVWTTPKTWNVGDVLTASDMNVYVRDNALTLGPVVTGVIPASGTTPTSGSGFAYTHVNGSGLYVVTFAVAYASAPRVQTQGGQANALAYVDTVTTAGFSVHTFNSATGAAADINFTFAATPVN